MSAMMQGDGLQPLQEPTPDLSAARDALGTTGLTSVVIEFEYSASNSASQGGSTYGGSGRLLYERPHRLRFERTGRDLPVGPMLNAWLDTPSGFVMWWAVTGRPPRPTGDGGEPAARRRSRQVEATVLLVGLLLADTEFWTYRRAERGYLARTDAGNDVYVTLDDGRVKEVRYDRGVAVAINPSAPAVGARQPRTQQSRATVSDFRKVGEHLLPHRLRSEFDQGWEEITVKRYIVNQPIASREFQPPASLTPKR